MEAEAKEEADKERRRLAGERPTQQQPQQKQPQQQKQQKQQVSHSMLYWLAATDKNGPVFRLHRAVVGIHRPGISLQRPVKELN